MILTVLTEKPAVQRNMLGEPQNDAPRLRLCANDDERYEICISIRDKLIAAHQSHVCHVAISHRLMVDECPSYKRKFDSIKTRDPHRKEKQESEWEYYVGIASKNVAQWEKKRSSLCAAARYWGTERLQYYEWFAQTKHFCKKLAVAAKRVPNWEEAVIKLNQIRLNRHHAVGKQRITADGPEIRCWDLDMLKSWINKKLLSPISDTNDVPLSPSLSPDISNKGNDEDNDEGNGEGNDELETGPIQDSLAIEITQFPTQWSGDDSEAALFLEDVRRELQLHPKRSKQSRTWGDDTRVREWLVNYDSAERESLDLRKMKKWHAVTEWALLSEGGHNTGSHMDSHGMGTWITVQEGRIGFGYISPDRNFNWAAWRNDHSYHGHRARYVVLKAGQTVYFPPGTIHFVFRSRKEQTFAIGGHVLQWSNILRFLHVLKEQETDDTVTNEDVTTASGAFWRDPIMGLVQERIKEGAVEMLGGLEVANRIMDILKNWEDCDLKMEDVFDLK
ncbi:unnamed protein product [Fusarium graminearum]|uniref:JmjC domain-containing protein n=1 Tax=Gibberella zeae TaxID=5518 RepID=A0A9N8RDG1_GIBZA|nr:unnamed protein product [Fusarium graminearum]